MERMKINLGIMTKDQLKKFIVELDKENKKLKEYQQRSQSADGEQIERLLGEKIKLEEENKNLKEERDNCLKEVKLCYNDIHSLEGQISDLEEENKKLEKENFVMKDRLKFGYKGVTREEIERVEEENKKLNKELEVWKNANKKLRMHDAKMEYENKKLREELSAYDREYFDEDKKAKNIFTEEDTLQ